MNWSHFIYLAPVALAAVPVLCLAVLWTPSLSQKQDVARRTPQELVLLLLVMALGLAAIYFNFYTETFGFGYWDIGSDTMEQYVPYYLNLINSIEEGTLGFFNYQYGLGASFMSYQSWTLDPFNLIVLPICLKWGVSRLSLALVIAHSAKVVLAGLLFDHLLSFYCKTPLSRVFGAALYAFCGYLLLWGQHYWLGSICVTSVALLVALEALMQRWTPARFFAVMLLSALSIACSIYLGFMIMLFAASYALVRVAEVSKARNVREWLRAYGLLALPAFCGVLLSCITLVPYAWAMISGSSRIGMQGQSSFSSKILGYLTTFAPPSWILPLLSRLLGNSLISSGVPIPDTAIPPSELLSRVNVFEFVSLGLSCGAVVLLLQFYHAIVVQASTKTKLLVALGTLFALLFCCNAFLPALNNVFAEVKFRGSFTVCILACIALSIGFEHAVMEREGSPLLTLAGGLLTGGVAVWSLLHTVNGRLDCLVFLAATGALVLLLILQYRSPENRLLPALVCLIIIGSQIADGFFTTNLRSFSSMDDFPLATTPNKASDTADALAYLAQEDDSFYRIEKYGYYDWVLYNDSLVQCYPTVTSYNSTISSAAESLYTNLWPDLFHVDNAYQTLSRENANPQMFELLGVRYLLSYDDVDFDWLEKIHQAGHVSVYRLTAPTSPLHLSTNLMAQSEADALGDADQRLRHLMDQQAIIVPDEVAGELSLTPSQAPSVPDASVTLEGRDVVASVVAPSQSVCCLALPAVAGWKVTIDQLPVETFAANYGLLGFVVPQGTHTIRASFVPRGLLVGGLVSCMGLVLGIVGCRLTSKAATRRDDTTTPRHLPRV